MAKSKIVSIEIELKDYEPIAFTMDEAKELYEQLETLFGPKEIHHHHKDWWYTRPYYTWYNSTSSPTITCANDLAGQTVTSNTTSMKVSYCAAGA